MTNLTTSQVRGYRNIPLKRGDDPAIHRDMPKLLVASPYPGTRFSRITPNPRSLPSVVLTLFPTDYKTGASFRGGHSMVQHKDKSRELQTGITM